MGKALIKGTIFGGIIVFAWMMISWMLIPWHCWTMNAFDDESSVSEVLMENTSQGDGIYMLPNFCGLEGTDLDAEIEAMKEGPFCFVSIRRYGYDFESAGPYVASIVIQLVGAFIITYLLLQMPEHRYWKRVWCVTLIGFLIGFLGLLPSWNWMGFAYDYTLLGILDLLIGWFLAGLAIAAVAKR